MSEGLTAKQRLFVEHYLDCLNASEAARRTGYSKKTARVIGSENLTKPDIRAAIDKGLAQRAMDKSEVLARLAEHARSDMRDFIRADDEGTPLWLNVSSEQPLHLIKRLKITKTTRNDDDDQLVDTKVEIELYDAQAALTTLARHHGLLKDGQNGVQLNVTVKGYTVKDASPDAWDEPAAE